MIHFLTWLEAKIDALPRHIAVRWIFVIGFVVTFIGWVGFVSLLVHIVNVMFGGGNDRYPVLHRRVRCVDNHLKASLFQQA